MFDLNLFKVQHSYKNMLYIFTITYVFYTPHFPVLGYTVLFVELYILVGLHAYIILCLLV